jgi:hypothetical protein
VAIRQICSAVGLLSGSCDQQIHIRSRKCDGYCFSC